VCLSLVDEIHDPPLEEERTGWKVFARGGYPVITGLRREVPTRVWVDEHGYRIRARLEAIRITNDVSYPTGWHVFTNLDGAKALHAQLQSAWNPCPIHRVRYRRIVAEGLQGSRRVDVAKEIYLEGRYSFEDGTVEEVGDSSGGEPCA